MMSLATLRRACRGCQKSQAQGAMWRQGNDLANVKRSGPERPRFQAASQVPGQLGVERCDRAPGTGRGQFPAWAARP